MFSGSPGSTTQVVDSVFFFFIALSVVLLVFITTLMVVFVVKYRRTKHPKAEQIKENTLLEVIWTAVPTLIVLGLFYWGWMGYRYLRIVPSDAMTVHVIASKWSWLFEYENGKQTDELHVPLRQPVKLLMESRDVLHSFYVPAFRVKQDVVPGMETYLWFEVEEEGTYDILCTEYCGDRHSYMLSRVIAVPREEFDTWYGEASTDHPGLQVWRVKGCKACHSIDGTKLVGRSFKGIYGEPVTVTTDGKERTLTVDDAYIRRSILEPQVDIVKGYPNSMVPQGNIVDETDINMVIEFIKTLK